jgi:hypothetical protein
MNKFGKLITSKTNKMNRDKIIEELIKIQNSSYAKKTDKQLWSYERLSEKYKEKNNGAQPEQLRPYNNPESKQKKLTREKVKEIRSKYNPYVYGKKRLADEYGVSTSVIYRIIKGKSWKGYDDSS